ncbi:MAG: hypothetical protein ACREQ5_04970 [Candidatus Dormibacteria bacterium]
MPYGRIVIGQFVDTVGVWVADVAHRGMRWFQEFDILLCRLRANP